MATDLHGDTSVGSEVFKALGDPIRLDIIRQIAAAGELAWSALEETLPVSKPTISYHIKTLVQAGLLTARKEGRNFYYTLRQDTLRQLVDEIWALSPQPRAVRGDQVDHSSGKGSRRNRTGAARRVALADDVAAGNENGAVILTW
jgi:DNA-binding transcriptional ArsR family regulator